MTSRAFSEERRALDFSQALSSCTTTRALLTKQREERRRGRVVLMTSGRSLVFFALAINNKFYMSAKKVDTGCPNKF